MDVAPNTPSATHWEWQARISDEERRKLMLTIAGGGTVIVASIAAAVLLQSRFMIVLAVLVAGIGALSFNEHRRLLATRCAVADDGELTISDTKSTTVFDLAHADSIEIRQRSSNSGSFSPGSRWSIEIAGPSGAVRHSVANVAGLFLLSDPTIDALRAELRRHASERGAGLDSASADAEMRPFAAPVASVESGSVSRSPVVTDRFEWQPRLSPNADRNRWLVRAAFAVPAAMIAVYAVIAYWDEGALAVVLSAVTVPGFLLLAGFGLDVVIGRARSFRIVVEGGDLSAGRPPKMRSIPLAGSQVVIDQHTSSTTSADGQVVRSTRWHLDVTQPAGEQQRVVFPSFGTATTSDDYLALERELRRRC